MSAPHCLAALPLLTASLWLGCALAPAALAQRAPGPLRIGVVQWLRENRAEEDVIVPPVYSNHLPKTLTYETLVVVDHAGRVQPGLAERWQADAEGLRHVFHLRPGATFHDGSPCDAAAVKRYFESWLVRDQDRFIGLCERITRLEVLGDHTLAIHLREPYALLCDLALMNPMGIVGGPISTWSLKRGHVDAVVESWRPSIPRDLARELVASGEARLVQGPGSMVQILCFNHERGPFAQRPLRAVVRDAVDRDALIGAAEHGFARPCTTVFAPEIADWPDVATVPAEPAVAEASTAPTSPNAPTTAEVIVVSTDPAQLWIAVELQRQLQPHGIDLRIAHVTPTEHGRRIKAGEYDLYVTRTWGTPYDPQATLYSRFRATTQQQRNVFFSDPELTQLIDAAQVFEPGPERAAIYTRVQRLLDERIAVVPLYVPDRIALLGPHVDGIELGSVIYGIDLAKLRRID